MTVSIIGVGPGDAELMTLKAARLLGEAQAAVYDRLIGHDVLHHLSPLAERHDVGKTPGRPGPSQEHINGLLTDLGSRLDRVVRIKGGDPYVFGRGIEEVRACIAAGIDVEVVPGISSALAGPLSAGISITEREVSSGFCVVTAHQDPGSDPLDWSALVRSGLTIVVMMGARRAADVRDALLAAGLSHATPAAVATDATGPDQHNWYGPLGGARRYPGPVAVGTRHRRCRGPRGDRGGHPPPRSLHRGIDARARARHDRCRGPLLKQRPRHPSEGRPAGSGVGSLPGVARGALVLTVVVAERTSVEGAIAVPLGASRSAAGDPRSRLRR